MMGTIRRNGKLLGLLAGLGALTALPAPAEAGSAQVFQLRDGYNLGPQGEDTGPGAEQSTVAWLQKGEDIYLVTVWMMAVDDNDEPWQGACSSVKLTPNELPSVHVPTTQITNFQTNGQGRVFNHPALSSAQDMGKIILSYGSDKNNANPQTFVRTLDENCQLDDNEIKISNNNNNNEGAPHSRYVGNGRFLSSYLSTNNNEASYAVGLTLTASNEIQLDWRTAVVAPSNIGRPVMELIDSQRMLFCASRGDNRPPEDGVQCGAVNVNSGEVMWLEYIDESNPGNQYYVNQPSIAKLDNNRFAVQVLISSGQGKNNNLKGSNVSNIHIIEVNETGYLTKDIIEGLGTYQTHSTICGGAYGEDGQRYFGIFGASITGNGQPALQFGSYAPTTGTIADTALDKWVVGWYGDSGHLANLYGENPNNQGREWLTCEGDMPNPGFGNQNGYMPDVETFFVVPHTGRVDGEPKTSQWLSLLPGKVNIKLAPEQPESIEDAELGAEGQGETVDPADNPVNGGGDGDGDGDGDSGGTNGTPSGGDSFGNNAGGCACSTPGTASSGGTSGIAGALALLGLATLVSRRRKES